MPYTPRAPIPHPGPWGLGSPNDPTKEQREASLIVGIVVDGEKHSIRGAKVELIKPTSNTVLATTTTNRGGFYSFMVNVEEGEYKVKVIYGRRAHVQEVRAVKGQLSQLDFNILDFNI
jgi:hypothetical protein